MHKYFVLFIAYIHCQVPEPIIHISSYYNLDTNFTYRWAIAESSCNTNAISTAGAIGLYQITDVMLDYYKSYNTNCNYIYPFSLYNPYINTEIACWYVLHEREKGFDDKVIVQLWLFGKSNVLYNFRWSSSYEKKIFGSNYGME